MFNPFYEARDNLASCVSDKRNRPTAWFTDIRVTKPSVTEGNYVLMSRQWPGVRPGFNHLSSVSARGLKVNLDWMRRCWGWGCGRMVSGLGSDDGRVYYGSVFTPGERLGTSHVLSVTIHLSASLLFSPGWSDLRLQVSGFTSQKTWSWREKKRGKKDC